MAPSSRCYFDRFNGTTAFHPGDSKTIADVEFATGGGVGWSNRRRLRFSLGIVPPVEYEQAHWAALIPEVSPT